MTRHTQSRLTRSSGTTSYYLNSFVGTEVHEILIPSVEGANGFIITDFACLNNCTLFEDTGEGPIGVAGLENQNPIAFSTGIPLVVGSVITVTSGEGDKITISGYVY